MFKRDKQPGVVFEFDNPQPKKGRRWRALKHWVATHKKLSIAISIVLLIAISAGVVLAINHLSVKEESAPQKQVEKPKEEPKPVVYYSNLTGAQVESEAVSKQAVTAIMIENSPDARPQSGLKNSGVVFEAVAEGGITRFLALYQEQKPQLVGPVRSVRMYYVDWLAAFNASVAHVGGSANALAEVRSGNYRDIDQFFNAGTYWRASDRYAPHNVYTSFEKIDALNKSKGYETSSFTGFKRKDSSASEAKNATSVNVTISGPTYNSSYVYNADTNSYDRSQAGAPHLDREDGQISPRVVIVMKVDESTVMEDGLRQNIITIGSGSAYIFQDGAVNEVTWTKPSRSEQITFKDAAGNDAPLARGQTWITAVPNNGGGVTWQ